MGAERLRAARLRGGWTAESAKLDKLQPLPHQHDASPVNAGF